MLTINLFLLSAVYWGLSLGALAFSVSERPLYIRMCRVAPWVYWLPVLMSLVLSWCAMLLLGKGIYQVFA